MSTPPNPFNPSQTVERIREIIVGRHLERLEQRVAKLEAPEARAGAVSPSLEDRFLAHEAHIEALKQNVQRLGETTREDAELRSFYHREETQRLAAQIQQITAARAQEADPSSVRHLEQKVGHWLGDWQQAFHQQLNDREEKITSRLRNELAGLWESTESHITRVESRLPEKSGIEERFHRIAQAARALADAASPPPAGNGAPAR